MRRILTLVRKDFLIFLKDRVAIALGFVVPLVMILVFGLVFGGSGEESLNELRVLCVNQDTGPGGARLKAALDGLPEIEIIEKFARDSLLLDSATARLRVERGRESVAIIIPSAFSDSLLAGRFQVSLLEDPRDPLTSGIVSGLMQQQAFQTFPGMMPLSLMNSTLSDSVLSKGFSSDLRRAIERNFGAKFEDSLSVRGMFPREFVLGENQSAGSDDPSGFNIGRAFELAFQIRHEEVVGQNIVNPGIAQSVAGPAVMFMLFAVGAIAASLLREMRGGTAQRALVGGVEAGELLLSKFVYAVVMGSLQLVVMMIYGYLVFDLQIFHHSAAILIVIFCSAVAMSGIGLITAAFSRTEEQAAGLQVVLILGMSAIGGAMFPSFMIPKAVRALAQFTPVHWSMQGFLDVFWRDQSLPGIAVECGVLLLFGVLSAAVAVVIFRRRLAMEFN